MTFPGKYLPNVTVDGATLITGVLNQSGPAVCVSIGTKVYVLNTAIGLFLTGGSAPVGVYWVDAGTGQMLGAVTWGNATGVASTSISNGGLDMVASGTDLYITTFDLPAGTGKLIKFNTLTEQFTDLDTLADYSSLTAHAGNLYLITSSSNTLERRTIAAPTVVVDSTAVPTAAFAIAIDTVTTNYGDGLARVWAGPNRYPLTGFNGGSPEGTPFTPSANIGSIGVGSSSLYFATTGSLIDRVDPDAQTISATYDMAPDFDALNDIRYDSINSKFMLLGSSTGTRWVGRISLVGAIESTIDIPLSSGDFFFLVKATVNSSKFFFTRVIDGNLYSTATTGALVMSAGLPVVVGWSNP